MPEKTVMDSTLSSKQLRYLLNEEAAGRFGEGGLGPIFQWVADNRPMVDGLRTGELLTHYQFPCRFYCPELIPKDNLGRRWEITDDITPAITKDSMVHFISHLKEGGGDYLRGDDLHKRAVELRGNHGLSDGKILLDNQEKMIPESVRGKFIVLTGTLMCNPGIGYYHPCLRWDDVCWVRGALSLFDRFKDDCVLPCIE